MCNVLQSFLGFNSHYLRFLMDFATITNPLHRLTLKDRTFNWDMDAGRAFTQPRVLLGTAPVLDYPDPKHDLFLPEWNFCVMRCKLLCHIMPCYAELIFPPKRGRTMLPLSD